MPYRRLVIYYFCYYAFFGIYTPYFGLYLSDRGYAAAQIGMLMAVFPVVRLFAPNLGGLLADSIGRRMPVVRGAALLSLCGFAMILPAYSLLTMGAALAVVGFFWSVQQPLSEALTLAHLRETPGRYGIVRAWGSVGFVVVVLLMGWLLDKTGIRSVYFGCMLLMTLVVLCTLVLPDAPKSAKILPHAKGVLAILRQPEVVGLFTAATLMTAAHGTLNVFYSIHLAAAGYSKPVIGLMWTLGVVAEITLMMRSEKILKRFSVRHILLAAFACAVVRFLVIGWCVRWPAVMAIAQCTHAMTFGACHVAAISVIHKSFGEHHQAQGQAFYGSICYGAGGILGTAASGWLWESFGGGWAFSCSALLALLGGLVYWYLSRPACALRAEI